MNPDAAPSGPGGRRPSADRAVLAAVAVAFAARLLFGVLYWVDKPLVHDEHEYLALATSLATGRGFTYPESAPAGREQFDRAPLYPVFLTPLVWTDARSGRAIEHSPLAVKAAQSAIGALGVWLVALIAARAAGPRAAAAGAWIAALYPPLVWMPAYALSETLFSALALSAVVFLGRSLDGDAMNGTERPPSWLLGAAGVLTGAAALTRPAVIGFAVLAGSWLLWRRGLRAAAIFGVGVVLVLAPWTVRNARVHGRLVIVAAQGGVTFWTGNHPLSAGEGDMAANPRVKMANIEFRRQHAGLSAQELEPLYYREAFGYIAQDPVWWIGLMLRKAFLMWVPVGPSYRLHSARYYGASVLSYGLVLPFAVAGFLALRGRRSEPKALWLLAGSAVLSSWIFIVQERFRIPVVDPTLIVCAAAWVGLGRSRNQP